MELIIPKRRLHIIHVPYVRHINANGEVLWEQKNLKNILHDEGEIALLSAYFATTMSGYGAPPASLYIGLDTRAVPAEADTLASLTGEPAGLTGYARQACSTAGTGLVGQDFYINQPAAYYRADSKTVTFTAGELWTAVTNLFLTTVVSGAVGKLICTIALSASRTLQNGDSLNTSMIVGMSE